MTTPGAEDDVVERLREGTVQRVRRWSGDTHMDEGGPCDEGATDALMSEAAALIERLQKELKEARENVGYIYFNPDAGTEFSENHPIESGEVDDAENVREATAAVLRDELLDAWKLMAEENHEHHEFSAGQMTVIEVRNAEIKRLKQSVESIRAKTIDECAKVAEQYRVGNDATKTGIAKAIRSLDGGGK